jgi:hypothetical protein
MAPVSEKIDGRILRLLGLTDVFDLDYDTYLTLIREALVTGAKRLPPEELAILANERKRVRGKKGRFKPKQKINANNVATTKFLKPAVQPISTPLLPAASGDIQSPQVQPADLSPLQGPLESIKKTLSNFFKFRKDASDDERKDYEQQRRSKREAGLEGLKKGMGAVADATKKFVAPFQGIIDRIWRFILFTLLGRTFTQLMDWFNDPKNEQKIETLKRFLKDWWPTILGAVVLFLTPFGKFVRSTLKLIGGFAGKLVAQIPKLSGAIKGLGRVLLNPWVAIPAAAVGLAAAANTVTGQQKAAPVQTENKARAQTGEGLGVQGTDTMADTVPSAGNMGATTPYGLLQGAARGGSILDLMNGYLGIDRNTGHSITGFGPDTQLIAAMPGEVVINKQTVDALGADTFLSLNRYYGGSGANQPRFGRFKTGGIVGGIFKLQGGGSPVRAENPKMSSSRSALDALNTTRKPLKISIEEAQSRLLEKLREKNTNIKNNIRPWWEILNPFADRRRYSDRLPSHNPASKNYNMPGYDRNNWLKLDRFRSDPNPEMYKPNPKNPKNRFAPRYEKPGLNNPLLLRGGGSINDNIRKQFLPISRMGGGSITSVTNNYGMRIMGMGADTRFDPNDNVALQPGEDIFKYVLTKKSAMGGLGDILLSFADNLQARFDNTSNASVSGNIKKPNIRPRQRRTPNTSTITLPPINSSTGSAMGGSIPAGTQVPIFSAISLAGSRTRIANEIIYGIVG